VSLYRRHEIDCAMYHSYETRADLCQISDFCRHIRHEIVSVAKYFESAQEARRQRKFDKEIEDA